jgi:hypothetical protein
MVYVLSVFCFARAGAGVNGGANWAARFNQARQKKLKKMYLIEIHSVVELFKKVGALD